MFNKFIDGFYSVSFNYFVWKAEMFKPHPFLTFFDAVKLKVNFGFESTIDVFEEEVNEFLFEIKFDSYSSLFKLIKHFQNLINEMS